MTRGRRHAVVFGFFLGMCSATIGLPVLMAEEPFKPSIHWANTQDFDANDPHDPLVVRDKVIVGTDRGELRAYACKDGKPVWIYQDGERIYHRPCSDGEYVFFTSANGLTAVTADEGAKVWNAAIDCRECPAIALSKPAIVCVGGRDGILYAVDAKTGNQVWTSEFVSEAPPDPPGFDGERARFENTKARPAALACDGQVVYLSVFDQCRVVAVDARTGKRLWSFQTAGWVHGTAVATEKHVFIGSQDAAFYCLDRQTGKEVWKHATMGRVESGGAVDEKFVYFGSCDGGLYCLNQADGKVHWRFDADQKPDGNKSPIYSVPLLRSDGVYFAAGEGQAYALDRDTGKLKWKLRPSEGSELFSSPANHEGLMFLVTRAREKGQGEPPSLVAVRVK